MKRAGKIIILGVGFGVALLILQRILRIDSAAFQRGYWIAAPVVILGAALVNMAYNLFYMHKVRRLAALLPAGKQREYIAGMEALLKTAKGKNLRDILSLNLAAGYVDMRQFDTAIAMLEELAAKDLKGAAANTAHHINLCMSYFETKQYGKAMALYAESQPLFQKYRSEKHYGAYIVILDMLAAVREKDYARAEKLLSAALETYDDPRLQKAFHEIEPVLNNSRGNN